MSERLRPLVGEDVTPWVPGDLQHRSGCQFTRGEFTGLLKAHDIRISMDGKGSWPEEVFIERLWMTVTDEVVVRKAYDSVTDARANPAAAYIRFYNERRPHRALDGKTPDAAHFVALASAIRDAA